MPCDTRLRQNETVEQRMNSTKAALKRLETALSAGQVKVNIAPNGAVAFAGWNEQSRDGISDVCAYRLLTVQGSWALRQAVARAEAMSGRKVNVNAVAAGHHSHDGGNTWHGGH